MLDAQCALLSLQSVPGIGARTLNRMLAWAKQTGSNISDVFTLPERDLQQVFKMRAESVAALRQVSPEDAQALLDGLMEAGFTLCLRGEDRYPSRLEAHLGESAPPLLAIWGATELLRRDGIAFSGSRHTSPDGISRTKILAAQASSRHLTVISGHAGGTDMAAHRAALENGGQTILVLPEGALRFRPHAELQPFMASGCVAVISEFPPQMPWSAQNAMIRNQTIIGLAQALIVIEAGESGGTLDAGRRALKLKIPVHVLTASVMPPGAAGNALLIAEGAVPLPAEPHPVLPAFDSSPAAEGQPGDYNPTSPEQLSLF